MSRALNTKSRREACQGHRPTYNNLIGGLENNFPYTYYYTANVWALPLEGSPCVFDIGYRPKGETLVYKQIHYRDYAILVQIPEIQNIWGSGFGTPLGNSVSIGRSGYAQNLWNRRFKDNGNPFVGDGEFASQLCTIHYDKKCGKWSGSFGGFSGHTNPGGIVNIEAFPFFSPILYHNFYDRYYYSEDAESFDGVGIEIPIGSYAAKHNMYWYMNYFFEGTQRRYARKEKLNNVYYGLNTFLPNPNREVQSGFFEHLYKVNPDTQEIEAVLGPTVDGISPGLAVSLRVFPHGVRVETNGNLVYRKELHPGFFQEVTLWASGEKEFYYRGSYSERDACDEGYDFYSNYSINEWSYPTYVLQNPAYKASEPTFGFTPITSWSMFESQGFTACGVDFVLFVQPQSGQVQAKVRGKVTTPGGDKRFYDLVGDYKYNDFYNLGSNDSGDCMASRISERIDNPTLFQYLSDSPQSFTFSEPIWVPE